MQLLANTAVLTTVADHSSWLDQQGRNQSAPGDLDKVIVHLPGGREGGRD